MTSVAFNIVVYRDTFNIIQQFGDNWTCLMFLMTFHFLSERLFDDYTQFSVLKCTIQYVWNTVQKHHTVVWRFITFTAAPTTGTYFQWRITCNIRHIWIISSKTLSKGFLKDPKDLTRREPCSVACASNGEDTDWRLIKLRPLWFVVFCHQAQSPRDEENIINDERETLRRKDVSNYSRRKYLRSIYRLMVCLC